jgi:hypothetical protein
VGIIPFTFVKNAQGHPYTPGTFADYDRIVNITDAQFQVAVKGGTKAALITGNSADTAHFVYIAGRDNNSGTRANVLNITGLGVTAVLTQVTIGGTDGSPTVASAGNGGQSSGGTLAQSMALSGSATAADGVHLGNTGWYAIAYLGMYDADIAIGTPGTGDAVAISFNGVLESTAAIQEGEYAYWNYEYLYSNNSPSADATTVYTALGTIIPTKVDGTHTIAISTMHATKTTDTAPPTHN